MNPTQDGFIVSVTNPSPATNISATSVTATTGSFTSLSTSSLALGSINSTPIGNTVPSTGAFTTLSSTLSSVTLGGYTLTVAQTGTLGTMAFQGVPAAGLVYSTGSGVIPATIGSGLTLAAGGTLSSTLSGGTVTSVTASGGTTGLSFSGSPITTAGTLTLAGTLGIGAGGTGTSTAFTTGSVVFAGASGVYSQNNSQLFWDNTNNRLGIGTSSPSYLLDVNGTAHASTITLGTAGTSTGSVILSGATSGTFTLSASAAAGTGYGFGHAGGSATQSNAALLATSGDTNTYIVLTSKGTGGIIAGPAPDGTATGGNARGTYAADLQISRTANTQVASGNGSALIGSVNATASGQNAVVNGGTGGLASGGNSIVLGGDRVTASGTNSGAGGETNTNASGFAAFAFGTSCAASGNRSIALGDGNTASIDAAFAVGYQNTANGFYSSVAGGAYASAKSRYAYQAFGSGRFSATGDAQHGLAILRAATTATSAATLTADGAAAGAANIVNLVNNSAMRLTIDIVGRDTTNGNTGGWKLEAIMKRGANAAATALVGTVTSTVVALDAGWASQTTPTLTADTTNGGLNLSVTPITTNSCHWVARVLAVEVL